MGREKEDYRGNYEMLNDMFPGKGMLTIPEVMQVYGKSRNTVKRIVPFKDGMVSKATLARVMCP
jgi:hypothetical protein